MVKSAGLLIGGIFLELAAYIREKMRSVRLKKKNQYHILLDLWDFSKSDDERQAESYSSELLAPGKRTMLECDVETSR